MYVLHALFSEAGSWELWAEDSRRDRHAPPARKGPKGAPSPPRATLSPQNPPSWPGCWPAPVRPWPIH